MILFQPTISSLQLSWAVFKEVGMKEESLEILESGNLLLKTVLFFIKTNIAENRYKCIETTRGRDVIDMKTKKRFKTVLNTKNT